MHKSEREKELSCIHSSLSSDYQYDHLNLCSRQDTFLDHDFRISVPYDFFSLLDFQPSGDLDSNRPVPFRLTPNIAEFLTSTGVTGPLTASMVATARCLIQPQYKLSSFLRAILRDEYITWNKKVQSDGLLSTWHISMHGRCHVWSCWWSLAAVNWVMWRGDVMFTHSLAKFVFFFVVAGACLGADHLAMAETLTPIHFDD